MNAVIVMKTLTCTSSLWRPLLLKRFIHFLMDSSEDRLPLKKSPVESCMKTTAEATVFWIKWWHSASRKLAKESKRVILFYTGLIDLSIDLVLISQTLAVSLLEPMIRTGHEKSGSDWNKAIHSITTCGATSGHHRHDIYHVFRNNCNVKHILSGSLIIVQDIRTSVNTKTMEEKSSREQRKKQGRVLGCCTYCVRT